MVYCSGQSASRLMPQEGQPRCAANATRDADRPSKWQEFCGVPLSSTLVRRSMLSLASLKEPAPKEARSFVLKTPPSPSPASLEDQAMAKVGSVPSGSNPSISNGAQSPCNLGLRQFYGTMTWNHLSGSVVNLNETLITTLLTLLSVFERLC